MHTDFQKIRDCSVMGCKVIENPDLPEGCVIMLGNNNFAVLKDNKVFSGKASFINDQFFIDWDKP